MFKTASWDADDNETCNKMFQNPPRGKIKNKSKKALKIKNKVEKNNSTFNPKILINAKSLNKKENPFIVKDEKFLNKNGNQSPKKNKKKSLNINVAESPSKVNTKLKSPSIVKKKFQNKNGKESQSNKEQNGERIKLEKNKKKNKNKLKLNDQNNADKISKYEALQEKRAKIKTNNPTKDINKCTKKAKLLLKLKETMQTQADKRHKKPVLSLREKMMAKLKSARFRYLNEQIYTTTSKEAQNIFKTDPDAFQAYHEGYRQQVERWPLNPVDNIIDTIKKMPKNYVISDFGCGDAKLAKSVTQKVHSFDLVASNELVTACDMAHVPLQNQSVDVVVFCLSLMGTNLHEYLLEANRVLKVGGFLKIAEVESRFDDVDMFIKGVETFGFKKNWKDLSHNLFYFLDFKKANAINNKKKLPALSLQPCIYKKR
ncbi:unnamed protein product [Brassicogethes aeneus]|uniref:Ribosomal RNA-processing protein 8 n=1 Tax=Brassicogethes aeneus TaxID=1431903 RepID=A0A9P0AXE6_BRAAE|nr:unnamed protein product [Brassicogethes aeneus]